MSLSDNSVDTVKKLYAALPNESMVAEELGISRQALYDYRTRHGIKYDPIFAKEKTYKTRYGKRNAKMIKMYNDGTSMEKLMSVFGMNRPAINYILTKADVKRKYVHPSTERNNEILKLREGGVPVKKIAEEFDMNPLYVSTLIYKMKKKLK